MIGGAESTSYVILRGLNYAAEHGAQIINMSFAGPKDPLIERGIAATAARGILMVAAAGMPERNRRRSIPPPIERDCSERNRRADKPVPASNRGNHIAISAPGADIFLPAPDEKYQITSGTWRSAPPMSAALRR